MVNEIAIIGAGGFGREISLLIDVINRYEPQYKVIGYYDDGIEKGKLIADLPVLGNVDDLNAINKPLSVVVAIGNSQVQKLINERIHNEHISFPNIIHPKVDLSMGRNQIGIGNIISKGFILTCDIRIGNFNVFNTRVSLGHDVILGDFNVFNPNTQISGDVQIGNGNFFGVNSCVLQGLKIGNDNFIGANTLVIKKVGDGRKYFGIPARILAE